MMKGYLKMMVLRSLSDRKLSGYSLIKQIESDTGTWKPSYGSIYPLLGKLQKEGLVSYKKSGRKKVYFLTSAGKRQLPLIEHARVGLADNMMAAMNAFGKIIDPLEKNFMLEVFRSIKSGKMPFHSLNPELGEFRAAIFDSYAKNKDSKAVKAILKKAVRQLRDIK